MPQVPRINAGGSTPRLGSVGRLRVNAPVEAFGGGAAAQGLAQLGKGVAAVGQGVSDISEKKEKERAQEAARQASIAKKRMGLQDDRLVLTYEQQAQALANKLKSSPSGGGLGVPKEMAYAEGSKKLRDELLSKIDDPDRREALAIRMEQTDLARSNSLSAAQITEDKKVNAETREAQKQNISKKMSENYETLRDSDNAPDWLKQFNQEATEYGMGLLRDGVPAERVKQLVTEEIKKGSMGAIKNMIANINANVIDGDVERIEGKARKLSELGVISNDERDSLIEEAKTKGDRLRKRVEQEAQRIRDDRLGELGDSISDPNMSDIDRQEVIEAFKNAHPELTKEAKTLLDNYSKETPFSVEEAWTNELIQTTNTDKYERDLRKALADGKIGIDLYNKMKPKLSVKINTQKRAVFDSITIRLEEIKAGMDVSGLEELPGKTGIFGRSGVAVTDDLIKGWRELVNMTTDPNVTAQEINQIADTIFFKPEAMIASRKAEQRLIFGRRMFEEARAKGGTQDLSRTDAERQSFNRYQKMSNEELAEEFKKMMQEPVKGEK